MAALPSPADPSDDPSLAAGEQLLETLETPDYWRKVCPHLTVNGEGRGGVKCDAWARAEEKRDELVENGFFHLERDDLGMTEELADALALGVVLLLQNGWPASFIFVFDEAWHAIERASGRIQSASGGSEFLGDLYAWYVDPDRQQKGWGPHRDRMGSGPGSFRADGTPRLSTTWLALTDAGPNNSCMYVVPRQADPFYVLQDLPDVDPLEAIFKGNPCAYQSIRALPCPKGCAWHFSHKIIHWGSHVERRSSAHAQPKVPRIAMSWVVGDSSFEDAAFSREMLPQPPLSTRVAFVAGQQIAYGGQTGLRRGFKSLCFRVFKRHASAFSEFYRDKVEFIFYCRPPPPQEVHLKESTKVKDPVDVSQLEFATPQDDSKLDGLLGMFGADSSSDEEAEEGLSGAEQD